MSCMLFLLKNVALSRDDRLYSLSSFCMSNPFGTFVILLAQIPDSVANPIQRS